MAHSCINVKLVLVAYVFEHLLKLGIICRNRIKAAGGQESRWHILGQRAVDDRHGSSIGRAIDQRPQSALGYKLIDVIDRIFHLV